MLEIQIDKNIDIPGKPKNPKRPGKAIKWQLPLNKMEIGDSIYVPITMFAQSVQSGNDHITHHCNNAISCQKSRKNVDKNYKFTCRQVIEGRKVIGARIWRIG